MRTAAAAAMLAVATAPQIGLAREAAPQPSRDFLPIVCDRGCAPGSFRLDVGPPRPTVLLRLASIGKSEAPVGGSERLGISRACVPDDLGSYGWVSGADGKAFRLHAGPLPTCAAVIKYSNNR